MACKGAGQKQCITEMQKAVTAIDDEIIQPAGRARERDARTRVPDKGAGREAGGVWMSTEERTAARGEGWSEQIRAARRALTMATRGDRAAAEDWEAVRQIMGGVIRKPAAASEWDGWESRGRIRNIAEAIGGLQDVAWRRIKEWRERTEKERAVCAAGGEGEGEGGGREGMEGATQARNMKQRKGGGGRKEG